MTPSEDDLRRIKSVADMGYETNALAELRDALSDDLSPDIHAAVLWGLNESDDPTAIW
mgnify:CR=1 FL=1